MRIGIVSPYSFDTPGGVQNHVHDLAETLISLGHYVNVLAPAADDVDRDRPAQCRGEVRGDGLQCTARRSVAEHPVQPGPGVLECAGELPECTLLTCQRPVQRGQTQLAVLPADLPQGSPGDVHRGRGAPIGSLVLTEHRLEMRVRAYLRRGSGAVEHRGQQHQGRTPVVQRTGHAGKGYPQPVARRRLIQSGGLGQGRDGARNGGDPVTDRGEPLHQPAFGEQRGGLVAAVPSHSRRVLGERRRDLGRAPPGCLRKFEHSRSGRGGASQPRRLHGFSRYLSTAV